MREPIERCGEAGLDDERAAAPARFIREIIAAWEHHDVAEMARAWVPDGDLLDTRGHMACGQVAVERLLADEHSGSMRHSRVEMVLTRLRFLPGGLAHADASMTVTGGRATGGETLPPLALHVSFVVLEVPDAGWRFMVVRPYAFLRGF